MSMHLSVYGWIQRKEDSTPVLIRNTKKDPHNFAEFIHVGSELAHALTGAFKDDLPAGSTVAPVMQPGLGENIVRLTMDLNQLPGDAIHLYTVELPELDFRMAEAGYNSTDAKGIVSVADFLDWKRGYNVGHSPTSHRVEPRAGVITVGENSPFLTQLMECGYVEPVPVEVKSREDVNTSHWVNKNEVFSKDNQLYRVLFGDTEPTGFVPIEIAMEWYYFMMPGMCGYGPIYNDLKMCSKSEWDILVSVCLTFK